MAVKTITIELQAYDALVRARQHPRESFTEVIRRARWDQKQHTGRALLAFLADRARSQTFLPEESIQTLEDQDAKDLVHPPRGRRQ